MITKEAAAEKVVAYATAHREWIEQRGIPTPAEVDALRANHGLPAVAGDRLLAADEWAIIQRHINPPLPDGLPPEAYYHTIRVGRIVEQNAAWVIVDRNNERVVSAGVFVSCIDATRHIETLQVKPAATDGEEKEDDHATTSSQEAHPPKKAAA